MTPISLMPPVDYCPSCEGRKAASEALDIGAARAEQAELQATGEADLPSPGAPPPIEDAAGAGDASASEAISGTVQTLLAPDLAVQATLGAAATDGASGHAAELRLRSAQAYQAT